MRSHKFRIRKCRLDSSFVNSNCRPSPWVLRSARSLKYFSVVLAVAPLCVLYKLLTQTPNTSYTPHKTRYCRKLNRLLNVVEVAEIYFTYHVCARSICLVHSSQLERQPSVQGGIHSVTKNQQIDT